MTVTAQSNITLSDLRARILRLPRDLRSVLPEAYESLKITVAGLPGTEELTISGGRVYLGGVTEIFRRAGILRTTDGVVEGRASEVDWRFTLAEGTAEVSISPIEDWRPVVRQDDENRTPELEPSAAAELEEAEETLSQVGLAHRAFFVPIARAIAELGGSARRKDVQKKLRSILSPELNDKQLDYLEVKHRYGWARKDLKDVGIIGGKTHGLWDLTELGTLYERRHRGEEIEIPLEIPETSDGAPTNVRTETVITSGFRAYEIPILRALSDGASSTASIYEALEQHLGEMLLPGDHRLMPRGAPVWLFRARWALSNLGKTGDAENVGRGEWKISQAGRERLKAETDSWALEEFSGSKARVRLENVGESEPEVETWEVEGWAKAAKAIGKSLHQHLAARLRPELGPTPSTAIPRNVVLYGPPGTGKTHLAKVVARALTGEETVSEDGRFRLVQFHPSYAYEDFVQGLRPDLNQTELRYRVHEGPFRRIAEEAAQDPDVFYVLVIDEINRGDPARIFGELLYALEYRDEAVSLPAGGVLTVPSNLVILGTMNSVDRSVALVDYALRRRFGFIRVDPDPSVIQNVRTGGVLAESGPAVLEKFNAWVRKRLGRDYQLGHSYFLSPALPEDADDVFDRIWQMDLAPLLEEYFYGNDAGLAEAQREWKRIVSEEASARAEVEEASLEEDDTPAETE